MRRIVYLSTRPEGRGPIYTAVQEAARETGYSVLIGNSTEDLRAQWMPKTQYAGDSLRASLEESELVAVHVSRPSRNLIFEVGMAVGMGKPVVLIVSKTAVLPFNLRTLPSVTYDHKSMDSRRIAFSLREIIRSLQERESFPMGSLPRQTTIRAEAPANLLEERMPLRDRIRPLISNVDGWDIQAATAADSNESFDFVIWNNNPDPRLLPLGNPIAIELKQTLNPHDATDLGRLAKRYGLRSIIVFSDSSLSVKGRKQVSSAGARTGTAVVVLDREDLNAISTGDSLVTRLEQRLTQLRLS